MVKKKIRGAGIKVSGDVTFGDVSGQVAIGENITQTQFLSFSNKRAQRKSDTISKGNDKIGSPYRYDDCGQ